jgi:hypothetical protein
LTFGQSIWAVDLCVVRTFTVAGGQLGVKHEWLAGSGACVEHVAIWFEGQQ